MAMEFELLGPVAVRRDGEQVGLGGPRQRALLALLLVDANEPVPTDRLIDELWPNEPPQSGATVVQNQVWRLRKALGADRIVTRAAGYAVRTSAGEVDIDRFRELVGRAGSASAAQRAALLREALGLCHGRPISDVVETPTLKLEADRLEEARLAALEDRVDADLELGRHGALVGELATLAARHPLRERLRAQQILALYRCGRQAEALDVYRETRSLLAEELGLEPGPELRNLQQAVLRQDPALSVRVAASPAERTRGRPRGRIQVAVAIAVAAAVIAAALAYEAISGGGTPAAAPAAIEPEAPRTPVTISDDFDDGAYDPGRWHVIANGPGIQTGERRGHLEIALTKDAEPYVTRPRHDLDAHYGTQCRFGGDFDARVEFQLLEWPRDDGVTLVFGGVYGGGLLFRTVGAQNDVYRSQLADAGNVVAHGPKGALRLVRRGGISTAYVRDSSDWVAVGAGPARGEAVIIFGLFGSEPGFGHKPVRVAFDNFSVETRDLNCARH